METYKQDSMDDFDLPPPPDMFLVQESKSGLDLSDMPPPPPPPEQAPTSITPTKINYLTAVTPKPYKSPYSSPSPSPIKSPSPTPPPPVISSSSSLNSSSSSLSPLAKPSLSRPSNFEDNLRKTEAKKTIAAQIANFALSSASPADPDINKNVVFEDKGKIVGKKISTTLSVEEGSTIAPKRESQWSVSSHHAEARMLGSKGFSMNPDDVSRDQFQKKEMNQSSLTASSAAPKPKVSFGSAKSSSSLAKMILQDRKNSNSKPPDVVDAGSTVGVNNNPKKIGDSREHHKAAPYYEDPEKLVPLTFRRSDDEDDENDYQNVIPAMKENNSPESSKSVKFAIPAKEKLQKDVNSNLTDNNYQLVRAEPFMESSDAPNKRNGVPSPGLSAKSSKSIANMILNGSPKNDAEKIDRNYDASKTIKSEKLCNYCMKPLGLTDGISAGNKFYHRDCFKCFSCRAVLVVKYYISNDHPYCEDCYKRETCPKCKVCDQIVDGDGVKIGDNGDIYHTQCVRCSICNDVIGGKIITVDDKFICVKCSKQDTQRMCGICNLPVIGDCMISSGKYFHKKCMKCSVCGEDLNGTYFTFRNKLICEKDYQTVQKSCSECGCVITDVYYTLDNGKVVCEKDYKKTLDRCKICNKPVEGKLVKLSGYSYHPQCFNCKTCDINLVGEPFNADEEKNIFCSECFKKRFAAICSVCKRPILPKQGEASASRLRALGKDFHPECFKCEDCGLNLNSKLSGSECYPVNNQPFCIDCCNKRVNG